MNRYKQLIYSVVLVVSIGSPSLSAKDVMQANCKELDQGQLCMGYVTSTDSIQWYVFTPKQTGSYIIGVGTDLGIKGTLYDDTKTNILDEVDFDKGELAHTLIENQKYYIQLKVPKRSHLLKSIYRLSVSKLEAPNDINFERQWGLLNDYNGLDINILPAWEYSKGKGVKVGILDTGMDYSHLDLKENKGLSSGYNFVHNMQDVFPINEESNSYAATLGHGTMVAGIIGAQIGNNEGICGIAPEAEIIPLKIIGEVIPNYSVYDDTVATFVKAVEYAQKRGVKIINCSFGGSAPEAAEREAMESAKDILFIIAAGNKGNDLSKIPMYPACYYLENAIVVGAVDYEGNTLEMSNYGGPTEIAAPGWDILSTYPNNEYLESVGTSMATPFVSGVAALIWSRNPELTAREVKQILISKDNLTSLKGDTSSKILSGGMINAYKALVASYSNGEALPQYHRSLFGGNIKGKIELYKKQVSDEEKTNTIIVKLYQTKPINEWLNHIKEENNLIRLQVKEYLSLIDSYVIECSSIQEANNATQILNNYSQVVYAEPNYKRKIILAK